MGALCNDLNLSNGTPAIGGGPRLIYKESLGLGIFLVAMLLPIKQVP